jgi:hypothetical protein
MGHREIVLILQITHFQEESAQATHLRAKKEREYMDARALGNSKQTHDNAHHTQVVMITVQASRGLVAQNR